MTPRRLTSAEAVEVMEHAFQIAAEPIVADSVGIIDETIAGVTAEDARLVLYSLIDMLHSPVDPASIDVSPDNLDEAPDMDACRVVIKTREWQ